MKSRSPVWIIVWFVFFFPVGLYLLWTNKNWSKNVKVLVTIGLVVLFGFVIFRSPSTETNTSDAIKPTTVTTKSGSPTPADDPCHQYLGSTQYVDCEHTQEALTQGQALSHPLHAKVTYDSIALYITNTGTQEWAQCTATVNETDPQADNFQSDGFAVRPGQTESVGWGNFANAENDRFNYFQTKPTTIDLDCQVGGTTDPKTGAYTGGQEHRSLFNL